MTDPRDKRRPVTSRDGFPVHVDPESTPPPTEMPISAERDYDSIPPTIASKIRRQEEKIHELTSAIARVWEARDLPTLIAEMRKQISEGDKERYRTAGQMEQLMPMVRALTAHVNSLARVSEKQTTKLNQHLALEWARALMKIGEIDEDVEEVAQVVAVLKSEQARVIMLEAEVKALSGMVAELRGTTKALTKSEDKKSRKSLAVSGGAAGVITVAIELIKSLM